MDYEDVRPIFERVWDQNNAFVPKDSNIEKEVMKRPGFDFQQKSNVKTASTPMETQKPLLKDENGEEVDVHMYRSPNLGLGIQKIPFYLVAYTDSDYAGASLDRKSTTGGKAKKSVRLMMEKLIGMEFKLMLQCNNVPKAYGTYCWVNTAGMLRVPQPSDPTGSVADEAVHKELGDSLVRAATTAFSLEAEQDSGNITKTRSKATPNESSSLGITSGGGPRCQETIGDTIAQTRLLDLEKTKTSQHNEIASLKRRVKKLKKKNRSRTHKLKRLYKVGLTARVESSDDEESLDEDASKRRRINAIDADEEITLVSVADDIVSAASAAITVNSATTITATINTVDDIILAQALEEMKSTKPKKKRIVIQELGESTTKISSQLPSQQSQDKAEFDEEERLAREKAKKEQEANIALIETWDDIQEKIDADHQLAERLQA
ncbi:hypothetical protein Tco_0464426 [Tanacetum coccineum]